MDDLVSSTSSLRSFFFLWRLNSGFVSLPLPLFISAMCNTAISPNRDTASDCFFAASKKRSRVAISSFCAKLL